MGQESRRRFRCEPLERRRLLAAVSWDGGGDGSAWNDPLNWSGDQLPTGADDVTLEMGGPITLQGTGATIKSLVSSVPLRVFGQTLSVQGNLTLAAETKLHAANLYIDGDLTVNDTLFVNLGYSNPASQVVFFGAVDRTIGGSGTINSLTDDQTSYISNATQDGGGSGRQLTIAAGIDINGGDLVLRSTHPGGSIVNYGDLTASYWSLADYNLPPADNGVFFNHGTITVNNDTTIYNLRNMPGGSITIAGGVLNLDGDWQNEGSIALGDATLFLGGTFTFEDLGAYSRTGGTVYLTGVLDNVGQTFTLSNTTGSWLLAGGTLLGGTYGCVGANQLIPLDGTFSGVTVASPIVISGGVLRIQNGMTLNSTITLEYGVSDHPTISFDGSANQTLAGNGSLISMSDDSTSPIINNTHDATDSGLQVTFGSGIEVTGPNLAIYSAYPGGSIINNGTFTATNWFIGDSEDESFTNNGSISADTFLEIINLHNNSGHALAANGAALYLYGDDWHNEGLLSLTDSDLYAGGAFVWADVGTIARSGPGSTHVIGTLDNTGLTLTLNDDVRDLYLDNTGLILGGTINPGAGGYRLIGVNGVLSGVTVNAPVSVSDSRSLLVRNSLVLNSTLTLGASDNTHGALFFDGDSEQTLDGTGNVVAIGDDPSYLINYVYPAANLTIGPEIEISGKNLIEFGGPILNKGLLSVDAGGAWSLGDALNFENQGTIEALGNSSLQINNLINDAGHTIAVRPGAALTLTGDWSNSGTIDMNGAMIVDYTGASSIAMVQAQLLSGYAGGTWTGQGIRSSRAASNSGLAVGYGQASDIFSAFPATFAGQSIDASSVLLRCTYAGDANLDLSVDTTDFNILASSFSNSGKSFTQGDFNYDTTVDTIDFNLLAANFSKTITPASTPATAVAAVKPAPLSARNSPPRLVDSILAQAQVDESP